MKPGKIVDNDPAWIYLKTIELVFIKMPIILFACLLIYVWVKK